MILNCRNEVIYGSFVLNQPPYYVDSASVYHAPANIIGRQPQLMQPGSVVSITRYDEKIIELSGRIVGVGSSRHTMEHRLDKLQKALSCGPANLKPGYTDERYYKDAFIIDQMQAEWGDGSINEIGWTAKFLIADPFLFAADEVVDAPGLTAFALP